MVWTRTLYATEPFRHAVSDDLRIAESAGAACASSRPFASLGDQNTQPDLSIYGGIAWVTWDRDGRIVVANDAGGSFHSRTFLTPGTGPTVAVCRQAARSWRGGAGATRSSLWRSCPGAPGPPRCSTFAFALSAAGARAGHQGPRRPRERDQPRHPDPTVTAGIVGPAYTPELIIRTQHF